MSTPAIDAADVPSGQVRAHRRQQRSTEVEHVALELFLDRGLDAVTAEEIAAAAGVSRRTFFRYFPGGKEEVVLADLRRRMDVVETTMAGRPPQESAVAALRASLLAMAEHYEGGREDALARARVMESSPTLSARGWGEQLRLQASLVQMVALRLAADPTTDLRPVVIVATMLAAATAALNTWLLSGEGHLSELVAEALDLVEGGLGAAGGRRLSSPRGS